MDTLFQLIQSLSQPEKRYFRMEVSKYNAADTHDYLYLYEWIEKQTEYDEEKLKKHFKNSPLLKRLPSTKNYLYNLILRTLAIYNAEHSSFSRITWLLQQTDILFAKGLYKQAKKTVEKAKKIAAHYQQPFFLLMISHWECKFVKLLETLQKSEEEIQQIKQSENTTIQALQQKIAMEQLHESTVRFMYKKGMPRNEADRKEYEAWTTNPAMEASENNPLQYVQSLRYSVFGMCNYMLLNKAESQAYSLKRVESYEAVPHIIAEDNRDYIVSVFNVVQTFYYQERYDEALAQIEKTKALLSHPEVRISKRAEEFYFLIKAFHYPRVLMAKGQLEEVAELGAEIKKEYLIWNEQPHKNRVLFMVPAAISACHFILENYKEALYWIRLILNDTTKTVRPDVLGMSRIIHLLIQYELGNRSALESHLETTQRYITEHKNMYEFELLMLRFVRQMVNKTEWDKHYTSALQNLKEELKRMAKTDSFEKLCIDQYRLVGWVEKKLMKNAE